jgi:kynureninase
MMQFFHVGPDFASELDAQDDLARFRAEFIIGDLDLIYLDGNSLGRLPKRSSLTIRNLIEQEWGQWLVRGWNKGWMDASANLGAKIARLVGAQPDEIIVTDTTSANLFKLAAAALRARPGRVKIISDVFNFPSDLYILQGLIELLGQNHWLELVPSTDSLTIDPAAIHAAIDRDTALVCLTHVAFKSAFMYDMAAVTAQAHRAGALMLWDLSHSTGAVPVDLNGCGVDLAVGCTYKYLNGGPGAPAFLYVRRDLQNQLNQPIWAWLTSSRPFAFSLTYTPASGINHYAGGTPPILSLKALEPALDIMLAAGIDRLRAKSIRQSEYLIYLAEQWLTPLGFTLGSPRQVAQRGSHVSLRHPEAYRINQALIARQVIPDFREPDNIRLGIAPLYNTFGEIYETMSRLRQITEKKIYDQYSTERTMVT